MKMNSGRIRFSEMQKEFARLMFRYTFISKGVQVLWEQDIR